MKIQIGDDIRDMTTDEKANYDAVVAEQLKVVSEIKAAEKARESAISKLSALGLTDAELAALIGA